MDDTEVQALAKALAAELGGSVISSSFPAEVGGWIREAVKYGGRVYRHMIPMGGATVLFANYELTPDGNLMLELQDTNAATFWRGTFRPVES